MSQSGMIGAALVAGFVLWLAANGKLQTYWGFLTGGGAGAGGGSSDPNAVKPSGIPGVPGVTLDPTKGLPKTWCEFVFGGSPLAGVCG